MMLSEGAIPPAAIMLWEKLGDRGWEPRGGRRDPTIARLIDGGWLKPCVMRCMYEAMDTGVTWTDAAKAALRARNT